jgi:hypothetical protein
VFPRAVPRVELRTARAAPVRPETPDTSSLTLVSLRVLASRLLALCLAAFGGASVFAQVAPPPCVLLAAPHDTGLVENTGSAPAIVASFVVQSDGADWLRLDFDLVELAGDPALGNGAKLRLVSVLDGAEQVLGERELEQWGKKSAYFNGDAVLVEVHAEPGTGPSRVATRVVVAGIGRSPVSLTQCGPSDDREPSNDPRIARLLPSGCTSSLAVAGPGHVLVSAGHCIGLGLVVEFEVPPSTASGAIVHPSPEHQYAVDPASVQFEDAGLGNDWAVFGCFPNPLSGLSPFARQQAAFVLAPVDASALFTARVAGHGLDFTPPEANQVQQVSSGPGWTDPGGTIGHQADTEGGNSGSPIEWAEAGVVVGIHTHGGCGPGGLEGNHGTSVAHPALGAALAAPQGICAIPDAPSVTKYCVAKPSSLGCLPAIQFHGAPSASGGAGSFTIGASNLTTHKAGVLVYSSSAGAVPFQGGIWCLGAPFSRTPVQDSGGAIGVENCSGTYSFDAGALIASGTDPLLVAGASVHAQWWMRDPLSQPFPVGLSDAIVFTIGL